MGSTVVRDARGVRWKVRPRRLRRGESRRPRSGPEEDSLRRRLAGVVAAQPFLVLDPLRGVPGAWRTPADTADIAMHQVRAEFADGRGFGLGGGVVELFGLLRDAVEHLRTPWSDTWQVEAVARGRIRRWAHWEVEGMEATQRAVAAVAAALETGQVPQPSNAVLVDVVDQRPPSRNRRSAGLGRAARAA